MVSYHVSSLSAIKSVGLDLNGAFYGDAIASVIDMIYSGSKIVGEACGAGDAGCKKSDTITHRHVHESLYQERHLVGQLQEVERRDRQLCG